MPLKKSTLDTIFILIFSVLGIILFFVSAIAIGKISDRCRSNVLRDGFVATMTLGAILVTLGLTYFVCNWKGGNCYLFDHPRSDLTEFYLGIGAGICLCLMIVTAVMGYELKQNDACSGSDSQASSDEKSNGKQLKFGIWFMFAISAIFFVFCTSMLTYNIYYVPNFAKEIKVVVDKQKEDAKKNASPWGEMEDMF